MAVISTLAVNMIARTQLFEKGMRRSTRSLYSFRGAIFNTRRAVSGLVKGLLAAAGVGGLGYGLIKTVRSYAEFEKQMAMVSTMLDEQTMVLMPKYTKAIKRLAVEYGESTEALSKGLYDILSASIAPSKALDVLTVAIKAAKGGMTDTGVAADAITTILNSYSMTANEAGKVSDILFAIVKKGKTTFGELAPEIGKVVSIAATAKVDLEELAAVLSTITRATGRTDLAITGIRGILKAFLKPSAEAIPMARALGVELSTTTLKTLGLMEVMKRLSKATPEALAKIAGRMQGLVGFSSALKQLGGMLEDYDFMLDSTGRAQEAFDKMTGTLSYTLSRLKMAFKMLAVTLGQYLAPAVKSLSDYLLRANKRLTGFLTAHRTAVSEWAEKVVAHIVFIKDAFVDFMKYLYTDWQGGLGFIFDAMLELMRTAFRSAALLAIAGGKGIWKGIKEGLLGGKEGRINEIVEKLFLEKYPIGSAERMIGLGPPMHRTQVYHGLKEEAEREYLKKQVGDILGPTLDIALREFGEALNKIKGIAPPEVLDIYQTALNNLDTRLCDIYEKYLGENNENIKGLIKESTSKWAGLTDAVDKQLKPIKKPFGGEFKELRPALVSVPGLAVGVDIENQQLTELQRQSGYLKQIEGHSRLFERYNSTTEKLDTLRNVELDEERPVSVPGLSLDAILSHRPALLERYNTAAEKLDTLRNKKFEKIPMTPAPDFSADNITEGQQLLERYNAATEKLGHTLEVKGRSWWDAYNLGVRAAREELESLAETQSKLGQFDTLRNVEPDEERPVSVPGLAAGANIDREQLSELRKQTNFLKKIEDEVSDQEWQ